MCGLIPPLTQGPATYIRFAHTQVLPELGASHISPLQEQLPEGLCRCLDVCHGLAYASACHWSLLNLRMVSVKGEAQPLNRQHLLPVCLAEGVHILIKLGGRWHRLQACHHIPACFSSSVPAL